MAKEKDVMKEIVNLCKQRGFVYQNSGIYGGLANTWDYGPLGSELKKRITDTWWKYFVQNREDMLGLDAAILMNPKVWEASGHVGNFSDPLVDCKECKERFRADHLLEDILGIQTENMSFDEINKMVQENEKVKCPSCGKKNFTEAREFNLMFKTHQGVTKDTGNEIYMRPETAQGIFVNFKNVQQSSRKKLPFGVGQIGKAFRNEITPGNFIFRTREFEQMEIEYFVKPGEELDCHSEWMEYSLKFFTDVLGIKKENLRFREHEDTELSHYSNKTVDIEYKFPFGWGELEGIASRTDFDLKQHSDHSKQDLTYFDPKTNERYLPYVIEPSFGVGRTFLTVLIDAYEEEDLGEGKSRKVLKISPHLAPIQIAVLPLKKNEERIVSTARDIVKKLQREWVVAYDDTAAIGKLYRRQDEIGTPFCITVDFDTIDADQKVTVRDRDSMSQERVEITKLTEYFREKFAINY